jgi:hypothetical protein
MQDKLDRPSACGRGPRQNIPLSRAGALLGENCGTARCIGEGTVYRSGARIRQKLQRNRAHKSLRCGSRLSGFPSAKNIRGEHVTRLGSVELLLHWLRRIEAADFDANRFIHVFCGTSGSR